MGLSILFFLLLQTLAVEPVPRSTTQSLHFRANPDTDFAYLISGGSEL